MNAEKESKQTESEFNKIIKHLIEQRVAERLINIAAGEDPPQLPTVEQPFWYGHIRRRFGWPRWKRLSDARRNFLVQFGEAVIGREHKRLDQKIEEA